MKNLVPSEKVCVYCGLVAGDKMTVGLPRCPVCDSCDALMSATCQAAFDWCCEDGANLNHGDDIAKIYQRTIGPALEAFVQQRAAYIRGIVLAGREIERIRAKVAARADEVPPSNAETFYDTLNYALYANK